MALSPEGSLPATSTPSDPKKVSRFTELVHRRKLTSPCRMDALDFQVVSLKQGFAEPAKRLGCRERVHGRRGRRDLPVSRTILTPPPDRTSRNSLPPERSKPARPTPLPPALPLLLRLPMTPSSATSPASKVPPRLLPISTKPSPRSSSPLRLASASNSCARWVGETDKESGRA